MSRLVVRRAKPGGPHGDSDALALLRRGWTEELGEAGDEDAFERRFAAWLADEERHRFSWLAELDGRAVGMVLLVVHRMPRPGRADTRWGYLTNCFVLGPHRDAGVGGALVDALLAHAREQRLVRVVLNPSARSVPFYARQGFRASSLLQIDLDGGNRP